MPASRKETSGAAALATCSRTLPSPRSIAQVTARTFAFDPTSASSSPAMFKDARMTSAR